MVRLLAITVLFVTCFSTPGSGSHLPRLDNLTYLDDWNPNDFVELLDVWVGADGLAYVTGVGAS